VTGESGLDEDTPGPADSSFDFSRRLFGDASRSRRKPSTTLRKGREKNVAHEAELFTASQPTRPPPQNPQYAGIFRNGETQIRTGDTTIFRDG